MNKNILLVDDEYDVISGYTRNLRKHFNIKSAANGREGLQVLADSEEIAVVITDFRMPEMDGIEFLTAVQRKYPETIRIIITGHADLQLAMDAVNKGNIFRFLTKPIAADDLIKIINESLELYRLKRSEKELLNNTLKGIINILIKLQAQIQPCAVNQISKLKEYGKLLSELLKIPNNWEFELALMLSKLGCVMIPQEIIESKAEGKELNREEINIFNSYPELGATLIEKIPRFENIALAIKYQMLNYDGSNSADQKLKGENIPVISRILKIIDDFGSWLAKGLSAEQALERLKESANYYDPKMLSAMHLIIQGSELLNKVISLKFRELRIGMLLIRDIKDNKGNVLVRKGTEISDIILMKLIQVSKVREISEPILVTKKSYS